ncbi:MAG: hypothetical protein HY791_28890 [Deltaproteobacteria bacterium]|nr:hypothetical protein [Deltaproteobacteria bacterium]
MDIAAILQRCLEDPNNSVGGVERNTEQKFILLTLAELGWDIADQLAFNFQIQKELVSEGALASVAADVVARDSVGLCLVGEVKSWRVGEEAKGGLIAHRGQLRRYTDALCPARSFLTSGQRWIVFGPEGEKLLKETKFSNAQEMIAALRPLLAPSAFERTHRPKLDWAWGVGQKDKRRVAVAGNRPKKISVSPPRGRQPVEDALAELVDLYRDKVYVDHTDIAAQLKVVGSGAAFLEIAFTDRTPDGIIRDRKKDRNALPVPDEAKSRLASLCRRPLTDLAALIGAVEGIVSFL